MLAAVNSKHGRYEPVKYMMDGKALARQAREARDKREGLSGEQVIGRIRAMGWPVIDLRAHKGGGQ